MELEWEPDFETGNEYVDLQHRYFADLINRVAINFRETDDTAYKAKLISELGKYADFHFTSEENIATSRNLPGVSAHHQRHQELLEEFNHIAEDLNKGQKTVEEFLSFLTNWFIGHTVYEDKKLFRSI
ncbi:MAG: hemerythrin family protein [Deltaproteobacteria bacterium]|jgi:hemerythrin|nr:hemerythrin family protein [Deltaproteobacteria bacterium]